MDPERWKRVEDLFHQALEREGPARSLFLDQACGHDQELRQEVDRWLAADDDASARLDAAVGGAVRSLHIAISPGARLGSYEILALHGEGGMGTVYRARRSDAVFEKEVAIKVVKRGLDSGAVLRRFQRERRILARLEHPYIARVMDGGSTDDGLPYLVMEYVEGRNLLEYAAEQRLDVRARMRLFLQVCEGVEYAHQNRIVHRDLKPGNILVDSHGRPRILDFGIAAIMDTGGDAGTVNTTGQGLLTPRYASPEQVMGEPVTAAFDVYSLGVVLRELLTGCAADDLDRIVVRAVEKDPHQRYSTVQALAEDIGRYLDGLPATARAPAPGSILTFVRRRRTALLAALAVVLAAGVGAGYLLRPAIRSRANTPPGKIILAVLPMENLTGIEERGYFVDGLHDEMISRLGRLRPERLGVIARTSMLQYIGTRKSIVQIGRELGAHYILESSLRQAGERIRVSAQLIQVSDQTQLWVENYERELGQMFSVQSEIGAHVADALAVDVLPQALATVDRQAQLSAPAYAAYLRGQYYWHRRWLDFPANLQRAIDQFQEVVRGASAFADGHVALARSYHYWSANPASPAEREVLREKARAALSNALQIDSELASAKTLLAWMRFRIDWDFTGAEGAFREALAREPNSSDAHQQMATFLAYTSRHQEADHEIRLAEELDPLSPTLQTQAFYIHMVGRRWDKAHAAARKHAELVPGGLTHVDYTSVLLALEGKCGAALDELAKFNLIGADPPADSTAEEHNRAYALGSCGKRDEALRIVRALERRLYYPAQRIAAIHAGLGDRVAALKWLEESFRRHEDVLTSVATDPRMDSLRNEPQFLSLLSRMGFTKN
jgi:TolB-like protein/tRNA A-37 threonylcarbamoyl transferase component Bud32/Flp pilus assembly protein TadD